MVQAKVTASEKLAINLFVGCLGGLILWDSHTLQGDSAFFPVSIGIALIILSAISALHSVVRQTGASATEEASLGHGLAGLGLLALFVLSAAYLGFVTSSLWFLPAMAWLGGERTWPRIVVITLTFAVLISLLFHVLFSQTMPPELIFGEVL